VDLLRVLVLLRAVPERELEARDEVDERELVPLRVVEPLVLRALELRALDVLFLAPPRPVPEASFV